MEKAKTHYDAKKQQNQELQEQLRGLEQLQTENKELRAEADRLGRELQQAGLKTKEAEQTCRHLTAQVRSLEAQVRLWLHRLPLASVALAPGPACPGPALPACPGPALPALSFQVAHADQQLRDLGRFQVATDTLKSREPQTKPQLDLSIDSLDLSCEEGTPLTVTRSGGRLPPSGWCPPSVCGSLRWVLGTGAVRGRWGPLALVLLAGLGQVLVESPVGVKRQEWAQGAPWGCPSSETLSVCVQWTEASVSKAPGGAGRGLGPGPLAPAGLPTAGGWC